MELTILVDNTCNTRNLKAEAGLSIYIEDDTKKILLDTGASPLFLENAEKLGINLLDITDLILSHGHYDHTWGLPHLVNLYAKDNSPRQSVPNLIAHPLAFNRRIRGEQEMGINIQESVLNKYFTIRKSNVPVWLTDKLVFMGEITRNFAFEGRLTIGEIIIDNGCEPDYMIDDSALVYKAQEGLVIITGCSHSGICNIVEQAKTVCQDNRILSIIGGLHLRKPTSEQINGTMEYMKNNAVKNLYACHCTDFGSRVQLTQLDSFKEANVGLKLSYT
ncbi:MAG: MBL fold metallo-hydrolase [Pelosinus sp.]|nr:MBL fold metallo-hydrolase [Pelosinus sp.]